MALLGNIARAWVAIVGVTAIVTSLQCFMDDSFLADRIYTLQKDTVNPAFGRLFGTWTCLAGVVRILCSIFISNKPLYVATIFSFVLALAYFAAEFAVFKTAALTVGVISPLLVSGSSTILMLLAYSDLFRNQSRVDDRSKLESKKQ